MFLSRFGEATVPAGPHQTVTTYDNINRHTTARSVGPAHVKQRKRNGAKTKINCQHIYTHTYKQTKKGVSSPRRSQIDGEKKKSLWLQLFCKCTNLSSKEHYEDWRVLSKMKKKYSMNNLGLNKLWRGRSFQCLSLGPTSFFSLSSSSSLCLFLSYSVFLSFMRRWRCLLFRNKGSSNTFALAVSFMMLFVGVFFLSFFSLSLLLGTQESLLLKFGRLAVVIKGNTPNSFLLDISAPLSLFVASSTFRSLARRLQAVDRHSMDRRQPGSDCCYSTDIDIQGGHCQAGWRSVRQIVFWLLRFSRYKLGCVQA